MRSSPRRHARTPIAQLCPYRASASYSIIIVTHTHRAQRCSSCPRPRPPRRYQRRGSSMSSTSLQESSTISARPRPLLPLLTLALILYHITPTTIIRRFRHCQHRAVRAHSRASTPTSTSSSDSSASLAATRTTITKARLPSVYC